VIGIDFAGSVAAIQKARHKRFPPGLALTHWYISAPWYIWACAADCVAVSADTSSAAERNNLVGAGSAAAFAALTVELTACKLPAASASISG
jgi:hypothetical protein